MKGIEFFEIRINNDIHTCPFDLRCAKQSQPTYRTVAEQIKTRYIVVIIMIVLSLLTDIVSSSIM